LAPARRPNTTLVPKKKQKIYTTATKTKKKSTSTPIIIKEVESEEDLDLVYRPENNWLLIKVVIRGQKRIFY
jgi:hypothetical protein